MTNLPLIVEHIYNAPVNRVWQAITDAQQMKEWYFDIPGFRAERGFEFGFTGGDDTQQYVHLCRVTEVMPEKKLSHSWRYEGYDGDSEVSFELFPDETGTRIRLTHAGLESFPPNDSFKRENFSAGWNHILGKSLKEFLDR